MYHFGLFYIGDLFMKVNEKGLSLIKHFESLHDGDLSKIGLQPKQDCVGIWTVAWGHACKNKEEAFKLYPTLTEKQAEELLAKDLNKFENDVLSLVKVTLNENQFSALVSFTYNCGSANLAQSTLLKKLNKSDYSGAANEFICWNKASGKVLKGLTLRREAEKNLFLDDNFL